MADSTKRLAIYNFGLFVGSYDSSAVEGFRVREPVNFAAAESAEGFIGRSGYAGAGSVVDGSPAGLAASGIALRAVARPWAGTVGFSFQRTIRAGWERMILDRDRIRRLSEINAGRHQDLLATVRGMTV